MHSCFNYFINSSSSNIVNFCCHVWLYNSQMYFRFFIWNTLFCVHLRYILNTFCIFSATVKCAVMLCDIQIRSMPKFAYLLCQFSNVLTETELRNCCVEKWWIMQHVVLTMTAFQLRGKYNSWRILIQRCCTCHAVVAAMFKWCNYQLLYTSLFSSGNRSLYTPCP